MAYRIIAELKCGANSLLHRFAPLCFPCPPTTQRRFHTLSPFLFMPCAAKHSAPLFRPASKNAAEVRKQSRQCAATHAKFPFFEHTFSHVQKTHGLSRKIQGTYFKISALYFKIYGLYFLQDALCVFALSERVKKQRKIPSKIWLCFSRNGIRTEQCVVCRNASASSEWRSGMPPGNNKTTGRKCLLIRPVVRYCF